MYSEQATSETPFLPEKELNHSFEARPIRNAGWFQRNKKYLLSNLIVIAVYTILMVMYDRYLTTSHCAPQSLVYSKSFFHCLGIHADLLTPYSAGKK